MPETHDPAQPRQALRLRERRPPRPCTSRSARSRAACRSRIPYALDLEYTRTMMGFLLFNPEPRQHRDDRPGRRLAGQVLPSPPAASAHPGGRDQPARDRAARRVPRAARRRAVHAWCTATARSSCASGTTRCDVLMVDGFDSDGLPRTPVLAALLRRLPRHAAAGRHHGRQPALRARAATPSTSTASGAASTTPCWSSTTAN